MKKAGMVLGIIGSAISIIIVLFLAFTPLLEASSLNKEFRITLINPGENSPEYAYSGSEASSEMATPQPADIFSVSGTSPEAVATLPPMPPVKVVTSGPHVDTYTGFFLLPLLLLFSALIGSGLGLLGALISGKKVKTGGILMIVGAVLNFFDIIGFVLLLLGGIFSLISAKQTDSASLI